MVGKQDKLSGLNHDSRIIFPQLKQRHNPTQTWPLKQDQKDRG